jgi:uncharacterized protein (DUF2236 family)
MGKATRSEAMTKSAPVSPVPSVPFGESAPETSPTPLLAKYLGDWRSLMPGGSAGIMQLMYPPLGAAVEKQSDFFDDPFGRVYRSIPQIWATILAPDGAERAKQIRDIHKNIKGAYAEKKKKFHALDPETYWWAHATFTWEVFESIRLFHPGGLKRVDQDRLYAETVTWYQLYGVNQKPVPPTYSQFKQKFTHICDHVLELTPAASHTLEMGYRGAWRLPLMKNNTEWFFMKEGGRTGLIGTIPVPLRRRFDIPFSRLDQVNFKVMCTAMRAGFRVLPGRVNAETFRLFLKHLGTRTRTERFDPTQPSSSHA